jgi:hypothetical protein
MESLGVEGFCDGDVGKWRHTTGESVKAWTKG